MRFGSSLTALAFLLVAIAAGMWPSWALASSLSPARTEVVVQASPAMGRAAFKPCYSAVRTGAASCFAQLGLPEGMTEGRAANGRHCAVAAKPCAIKTAFREAELPPPRLFLTV
jgi:hypothetical protein